MDYVDAIGLFAGFLTTTSFLPQVFKTVKTKSTKDISLAMFAVLTTGTVLWICYGFLSQTLPVLITNSITFILVSIILFYKIRYN